MKNAIKTVSFMMIATLLSKVAGLLRDIFIAARYGTETMQATAYSYASSLPVQLFDFTLGAAVLATFIPIFNGYLQKGEKKRAFEFSNNFINITVFVSIVLTALCMLFSGFIGKFIAPDLDADTQLLLQQLIIIVLPTTVFTTLAYSFVGILQSFDEFNIPAIISLVSNMVIILYLVFFDNIYGLCFAMLIGWGMQFVIQIPSLVKKGYKYRFSMNFKDPGIRQAVLLAFPILISSWLQPISVFVNKRYASAIVGGGPALDYANRFYIIVVGVFVFAITNYVFPALSKNADNEAEFSAILQKSIRVMFLIVTPIMVGMALVSDDVIRLIYGRGQFTEYSINLTASALKFYTLGMIAYGLNEILNKCFYSLKNPKLPMIASFIGIISTVVVSSLAIKVWNLGVSGLAFSSAISTVIVSFVLAFCLQTRIKFINKELLIHLVKVFVSSLIMAVVVIVLKQFTFEMNVFVRLTITCTCAVIIYAVSLLVLKVSELKEVLK